jgi:uncharacterized protein
MAQPVPVTAGQRLETLDVLRGFALLGILAMNIRAMAAPFSAYMNPTVLFPYEGASRGAYLFTSVFFDLKMMGLFSMLFGAGVLLYAAKPHESLRVVRGLWFRRMFWLLVIGLVHAYLIWDGDILVPYALTGIILLWWVRRLSARALFAMAAVWLLVGGALGLGMGAMFDSMPSDEKAEAMAMWAPTPEQVQEQLASLRAGYFDVVAHRASFVVMGQTMYYALFFFWRVGGMMMLGMALLKSGFVDGRLPASTYARLGAFFAPLGLGLAWVGVNAVEQVNFNMPERSRPDLWNYYGAVFASIGYAALFIYAIKRGMFAGLRRRLAAVGQMAFSNYLTHSILTSILFLGWGFNLAGRFDYAAQLLVVAAIWLLQLIVSPIWLQHFRFGPAEWLWRSLTYWRRQPMRKSAEAAEPAAAAGAV